MPWDNPACTARLNGAIAWLAVWAVIAAIPVCGVPFHAQTETVPGPPVTYFWQNVARIQGHLALTFSPDGAFSPDSSTLAVVEKYRVVLVDLADGRVRNVLKPRINGVNDLEIQSANFISPATLFVLATGAVRRKGRRGEVNTPELAFQWNIPQDTLSGKVDAVGLGGGYLPPRYFPQIHYLALYKKSTFELWDPVTARAGSITLPQLTHAPHLFTFSPDGHWLLLAQIETNSSPNPVVVLLRERQFLTSLAGHAGPVLGMTFSHDSRYVATASLDRKVRVFAVQGWKLVETLSGNQGPVSWAEFSPHLNWVASAGEDKTARIWSVSTGKPVQTLGESREPLATLGFSPDGKYLAATSQDNVYIWARTAAE
ncbi:MAG TPA: WD40 repeat domain-containing protein [Terriglobia bacterium]|nr:WD40 repeat domain-containing protein [Terriglobia bacterium]